MLDAAYAVLVRTLFAQLERVAGPDLKHGDRLRLENYALLEAQLKPLAAKVGFPAGFRVSKVGLEVCALLEAQLRHLAAKVGPLP